MMGHRHCYL
jgi:hypothetical protein